MAVTRARAIRIVVVKETLDMIRDRRTIITALVLPLVSFPILFGLVGYLSSPVSNPAQVAMVNLDAEGGKALSTNLTALIFEAPGINVKMFQPGFGVSAPTDVNAAIANLTRGVQGGSYDVGIVIPNNFSLSIMRGGQANVTVYYDPGNGRAQQGVLIVRGVISSISQQISSTRLSGKGVTYADLVPIGIAVSPVGKTENPALVFAADLFPSFLLYFTFLGAFYFMVDDIAGEKERRSLEALFTMAPSRTTIFLGKYLVAFLLSMVTTVLGLAGTLVSLNELRSGASISLPLEFYPEVLAIVAVAALSLSALGFCISTFAKNIREAQQYLSPIFFIFFLPLYFTFSLPPSELSRYAAVPIMGYTLLVRDLVLGTATAGEVALSIGVNVIFLVFLVWLGIRMLRSEKAILRSG